MTEIVEIITVSVTLKKTGWDIWTNPHKYKKGQNNHIRIGTDYAKRLPLTNIGGLSNVNRAMGIDVMGCCFAGQENETIQKCKDKIIEYVMREIDYMSELLLATNATTQP